MMRIGQRATPPDGGEHRVTPLLRIIGLDLASHRGWSYGCDNKVIQGITL